MHRGLDLRSPDISTCHLTPELECTHGISEKLCDKGDEEGNADRSTDDLHLLLTPYFAFTGGMRWRPKEAFGFINALPVRFSVLLRGLPPVLGASLSTAGQVLSVRRVTPCDVAGVFLDCCLRQGTSSASAGRVGTTSCGVPQIFFWLHIPISPTERWSNLHVKCMSAVSCRSQCVYHLS